MPVSVKRLRGKYRLVESSGRIAKTHKGHARDGGGHATKQKAMRQQRAINRNG